MNKYIKKVYMCRGYQKGLNLNQQPPLVVWKSKVLRASCAPEHPGGGGLYAMPTSEGSAKRQKTYCLRESTRPGHKAQRQRPGCTEGRGGEGGSDILHPALRGRTALRTLSKRFRNRILLNPIRDSIIYPKKIPK